MQRAVAAHEHRAAITGLLERRPELVFVVGDQAFGPGAGRRDVVGHLDQQGPAIDAPACAPVDDHQRLVRPDERRATRMLPFAFVYNYPNLIQLFGGRQSC